MDEKEEVIKILLNVINDFNSKWTCHEDKDNGVEEHANKIIEIFNNKNK